MEFQTCPFQQRLCPKCGLMGSSTIVRKVPETHVGNHYIFHECGSCGKLVHRIIGFDPAIPNGNDVLMTEPISSQEEIQEVLGAVQSLIEEEEDEEDNLRMVQLTNDSTHDDLRDRYKRMTDAKGHPHQFRHTFAKRLLMAGVPVGTVSILLGHRKVSVTEKHYSKPRPITLKNPDEVYD